MSLVELRGVSKVYGRGEGEVRAIDGIDLRIEEGDFVAVMGASGSGKSTCMNLLGCLDAPTRGAYLFRGVDVSALDRDGRALLRRHHLGFVFQGFNLLARTSAIDNVALPLTYLRVPKKERERRAIAALEQVGLGDRAAHLPNELSGGQQQRVAIARALVTNPSVVLADEPTGNLDSQRSVEIMELLVKLNEDRGITIAMVTHEHEMAEYAGRKIKFRDGKICSDERLRPIPGWRP